MQSVKLLLIFALTFIFACNTSYCAGGKAHHHHYPTRYSSYDRYDCVHDIGFVRQYNGKYSTNGTRRTKTFEWVMEKNMNGTLISTLEVSLRNRYGGLMMKTKIFYGTCVMPILRCNLTDADVCFPGTVQRWRPGAWITEAEPPRCPISRPPGNNGRSPFLARRHHSKRAPRGAKCFMREAKNNKNSSPCGTKDSGELLSLAEIAKEPADYSDVPVDNEADLILSRGDGEFYWRDLPLDRMFVCKKHYEELGRGWKRKMPYIQKNRFKTGFKCGVQEIETAKPHSKPNIKANQNTYITKQESEALLAIKKVFVPLGTASCRYHKEFAGDTEAEYRVVRKGYDLRDVMPKSLAESPATSRAFPSFIRHEQMLTCPSIDEDSEDEEYDPNASAVGQYSSKIAQQNLRQIILELAKAADIDLSAVHFTDNFHDLASSTQRKRIQTAKRMTSAISQGFAPDDPKYFEQLLFGKETLDLADAKVQATLDNIITQILDCFQNAPSAVAKQQTLAQIAPFLQLSEIQAYFPGLSPYYFKRARIFAKMYEPGRPPSKPDTPRQRISEKQLALVIQFITSPSVITDLPFGTAAVTYTAGDQEEIPLVVRTQVNERIYHQYIAYLQETNQVDLGVSRSTALRILQYCTATTRKSLQGLDYFTWAGGEAFSTLTEMAKELAIYAEDRDWASAIIRQLQEARQYLKFDYKLHIKQNSRIPDHSISYALSDPDNSAFADAGTYQVDMRCDRCEALNNVLQDIRTQIDASNFPSELSKQETLYEYDKAISDIMEMKKHIIRTIRQDQARTEILESLDRNSVYIQVDWAMKFLPESGRSPQSEWFGQRGTSWHITHVTARDDTGNMYRTRLFVHVFDSVAQDSPAVIAILHSVLQQIKKELPHIMHAYLRSDNAGCYHGAQTIAAVPEISKASNIIIKRWDFSDPQSGKGPCDRAAATIKNHVRLYAAENHRCTNAREFIHCANSYDGIKSVTMFHSEVAVEKRTLPKISGISRYNNFEYRNMDKPRQADIVVWQAYKIGPGLTLPRTSWRNYQLLRPMKHHGIYTEGRQIDITDSKYWKFVQVAADPPSTSQKDTAVSIDSSEQDESDTDSDNSAPLLFPCPEPGCVKTYQSHAALRRHLEAGAHKYRPQKVSLRDTAIGAYKQELEGLRLPNNLATINSALESLVSVSNAAPTLSKGWAIRARKACTVFNQAQREYLVSKFDVGAKTGRKLDPKAVAKKMRGEFPKDQWLTWSQIASYWSRLAHIRRGEPAADNGNDDEAQDENANCEEDITDDAYFNTVEDDIYDAINDNAANIFM